MQQTHHLYGFSGLKEDGTTQIGIIFSTTNFKPSYSSS